MNSVIRNTLAGLAATAVLGALPAFAQSKNEGYLTDNTGAVVTATGAGVCVRNGSWTPALAAAAEAPFAGDAIAAIDFHRLRETGGRPPADHAVGVEEDFLEHVGRDVTRRVRAR